MMTWWHELRQHPVLGDIILVALALLTLGLRQLAHRSRMGRRFDPAFTLVAIGLLSGAVATGLRLAELTAAAPYFDAACFGALAIGVVQAALTLFIDFYLSQRGGAAVSLIFRDVASVIAYFLVIVVVLRSTLDINLASLITTSAVLTVIVGLALQDVLGNLFSGLVLELEQPFSPGDWVRVGTFEGTVEQTGWRTTRLRTRVNELVTLPNAMLSKEAVVNYSRPDPLYGDTLRFDAAYEAPPNLVKEVVMGVLETDPDVEATPRADVRLECYRESSIGYAIRYWIEDFRALETIRSRILTNTWYALRRANVRMPFPARDVFVYSSAPTMVSAREVDPVATLRAVSLLAPLSDAALAQLVRQVHRHTFGKGEVVVREGEPGDSFYVIEQGSAEVMLGHDGGMRALGQLNAGDFFGEMSLLAGDPRSATVRAASDLSVLVVDRAAFKEIISADPAILEPLSKIATGRQVAQQEHRRSLESLGSEALAAQHAHNLRDRIRIFFGL